MQVDPKPAAVVQIDKFGEDRDWSGYAHYGAESEQLLAESVGPCWAHATA
jgi:hypothetical protein